VDTATIGRLLAPFVQLDEQRLRLISIYIDLLLKWNARTNLTAVRGPEEIVTRHFGESFFAAEALRAKGPVRRGIDLGSGAGFPGIPIALLMPESRFVLIESNGKKATFLREAIFALKLGNATVFAGRGEDYPTQADLVSMRAVERFEQALPVALRLLEPGGRIGLMIGLTQVDRVKELNPELEWNAPVPVPGGHSRVLFVGTKAVKVG
jgi:16S rRNA (guanine527-N7)-methyltransferase